MSTQQKNTQTPRLNDKVDYLSDIIAVEETTMIAKRPQSKDHNKRRTLEGNVPSSSSAQAAKQGDDLKAPLRLTQTRRVEFGLQNFDLSTKPRDSSAQVIAGCSTTRASISVPHPTTAKGKRSLEEALLIADQARQKELAQGGVTAKKTNPEPKDALEEEALNLLRCLLSDVDVSSVVPSSPPSSLKRKREDEGDETNSPQMKRVMREWLVDPDLTASTSPTKCAAGQTGSAEQTDVSTPCGIENDADTESKVETATADVPAKPLSFTESWAQVFGPSDPLFRGKDALIALKASVDGVYPRQVERVNFELALKELKRRAQARRQQIKEKRSNPATGTVTEPIVAPAANTQEKGV